MQVRDDDDVGVAPDGLRTTSGSVLPAPTSRSRSIGRRSIALWIVVLAVCAGLVVVRRETGQVDVGRTVQERSNVDSAVEGWDELPMVRADAVPAVDAALRVRDRNNFGGVYFDGTKVVVNVTRRSESSLVTLIEVLESVVAASDESSGQRLPTRVRDASASYDELAYLTSEVMDGGWIAQGQTRVRYARTDYRTGSLFVGVVGLSQSDRTAAEAAFGRSVVLEAAPPGPLPSAGPGLGSSG